MKALTVFILATMLFVCLTFAGKSLFGMEEGMHMENVECVNHCINSSVFPSVPSTALPALLFVLSSIALVVFGSRMDLSFVPNKTQYIRLTEPIRLFLRKQTLIPVMIRD